METTKTPKIKKFIFIGVSALLLFTAAITIFLLANRSNNGEELINQFEKAVNEGDISALEDIIQGNENMEISKQNIEDLIQISNDEPDYLKEIVFILKAQLAIGEDDKEAKMNNPLFKGTTTDGNLMNSGDYFITKDDGFFSSYQIHARPYSLTVSSEQEGAVIKINDTEILKTKNNNSETTVSNLAPGIYKIYGIKKYEFTDIETIEEIHLFRSSTFDESISLDLSAEGKQVEINSYAENVSIVINGKDTGEKATFLEDGLSGGDRNKKLFGPFPSDGSVTVQGELNLPWGLVKSEPHVIDNVKVIDITPIPLADTNTTKQLTETLNGYAQQHIQSLVEQDSKILKTASANVVEDHAKRINHNKTNGSYWKGEALGTKIDFANAELKKESNQYQIQVPVEFHYKEKEYYKGMTDHEPLEELFEESILTVIYEEKLKRWLVSAIEKATFGTLGYMENNDVVITKFN